MLLQDTLDLAELDTLAPDLDLEVAAAEIEQGAVGPVSAGRCESMRFASTLVSLEDP